LDLCCSQWPRHSPLAECVLSPVERAVFLLRELIEYGDDEIAAVVGKSQANVAGRRRDVTREGPAVS
jgi:hypothetical protein